MRLHIAGDAGPRRQRAFIAQLTRRGLENERRLDDIDPALGGLPDTGHEWDNKPAARVRRQRPADPHRAG